MYKTDFESRDFLRTEKDVKEYLSGSYTSDDLEEIEKYLDEISVYSITALIEEIERIYTDVPFNKGAEAKLKIIKELIQIKLGLGFEIHYLLDALQEEFEDIQASFKKLAKFKDHRHKTLMNLYTEKPVY